jgi:hypothetical protein
MDSEDRGDRGDCGGLGDLGDLDDIGTLTSLSSRYIGVLSENPYSSNLLSSMLLLLGIIWSGNDCLGEY